MKRPVLFLVAPLASAMLVFSARANPPSRVEAFARLPDWSGVWESTPSRTHGLSGRAEDLSAYTLAFGHPPYNDEWESGFQAQRKRGPTEEKACEMDYPTVMQSTRQVELTVTPEETLVTSEDHSTRHIYTDGRGHPSSDELIPSRMGDSIGHWEGDTLVVDTIARRAGPLAFLGFVRFSEAAHFTERIRMTDRDTLEDQLTVIDPVALTAPWRLTLQLKRSPWINYLLPYECNDDDRIRMINGKAEISPP